MIRLIPCYFGPSRLIPDDTVWFRIDPFDFGQFCVISEGFVRPPTISFDFGRPPLEIPKRSFRFRTDPSDFGWFHVFIKKTYLAIDILFKWLKILLCTCIIKWFRYIYIFIYFSVYFIQNIWANVSQSKLVPFSRCLSDYFKKEVSYHSTNTLFSLLLVCSPPSWVIWSSGARL